MSSAHAVSTEQVVAHSEPLESLLRREQVAAVFRVSPRTVTDWARTGKLQSIRTPGGQHRFRQSDVAARLRAHAEEQAPEVARSAQNEIGPARCVTTGRPL